jgi:hypothetical protein
VGQGREIKKGREGKIKKGMEGKRKERRAKERGRIEREERAVGHLFLGTARRVHAALLSSLETN